MKLDLNDLIPANAEFELSSFPDKKFNLKKITLRDKLWIHERFGKDQVAVIFKAQSIAEISEIAFNQLIEKDAFKTLDDFREAFVIHRDSTAVITAMIKCVGVSEPVIERLSKEYDEQQELLKKKNLLTTDESTTS